MFPAWEFQRDWGMMLDADYPYTSGSTGTETLCAHDGDKIVGDRVTTWGQVRGTLEDVKNKVKQQPLAIGVDASYHF